MSDNSMQAERLWTVYIVECKDRSLYTGITTDLPRRLQQHNSAKGAKYTRSRIPVILRYSEKCENYSAALRRESAIKKLSRSEKLLLCTT